MSATAVVASKEIGQDGTKLPVGPDLIVKSGSDSESADNSSDESKAFAFSFSEDDLIPSNEAQTDAFSTVSSVDTWSSTNTLSTYDNKPQPPSDPKIAVSQAILVSRGRSKTKPSRSPDEAVQVFKSRRYSNSLSKTRALSRSLSTLSRRSKNAQSAFQTSKDSNASPASPHESVTRVESDPIDNGNIHKGPRLRGLSRSSKSSSNSASQSNGTAHVTTVSAAQPVPAQPANYVALSSSGLTSEKLSQSVNGVDEVTAAQHESTRRHNSSLRTSLTSNPNYESEGVFSIAHLRGTVSSDRFASKSSTIPRQSDDMWSTFRTLDKDYNKFQTKTISLKTDFVKSRLLPFLKTETAPLRIAPEDLERRILVLSKWWANLLELLSGKTSDQIPGYDQVFLVEAICGLMERQEWRTFPSPFRPAADELDYGALSQSSSSDSLDSTRLGLAIENVHHSIRALFIQNLFSQLSLAVNKMAARTAQRSFVNFAGRTCAFAFFFCPGAADILIRLWNISPSNLRRLLKANEIYLDITDDEKVETLVTQFPRCLQHLAISPTLFKILKSKPILPLGMDKIDWYGSWLPRWTGKEGDMFFVFVEAFHDLVAEFLPPFTTKERRIHAPGLLLVQCQLFDIVKASLTRSVSPFGNVQTIQPLITFDDFLDPSSAAQFGAPDENRVLRLLRKVLRPNDGAPSSGHYVLAETFCNVLKAAAQSTSLYDSRACFGLLDILQEATPLFVDLQGAAMSEQPFLDCVFWIEVFKQMINSENTMTELRLYSFLYTVWDELAKMDSWRLALCTDLLLEENHFQSHFNHWCPLVRSYFMRLLCWRLARFHGEESQENIFLLELLMQNLQIIWSNFKYVERKADDHGLLPPSTTPANPAPGRRILLIRTGSSTTAYSRSSQTPSGSFHSGKTISEGSDGGSNETRGSDNKSGLSPFFDKLAATFDFGLNKDTAQKQGGLLRSVLGYRNTQPRTRSQSTKVSYGAGSKDDLPERTQSSRQASTSRASIYEPRPSTHTGGKEARYKKAAPNQQSSEDSGEDVEYSTSIFKFSLELADRHNYPAHVDMQLDPPRLPRDAQRLLESRDWFQCDIAACQPNGDSARSATYAGRALAEWTLVVNECQNFIERRRKEGVPTDRLVETPVLGVEALRKPG